jgi:hypothetical protein
MKGKATPIRAGKLLFMLIACFVVVCLVYGYLFLITSTISSADLDECAGIVDAIEKENSIPVSISKPGGPALFCDLGVRHLSMRRFDNIKIYGLREQSRQDAVIETLKRYRRQVHTKPLLVQFYEKQNWQTWSSSSTGTRGGRRGPESSIRKVSIE